MKAPVTAIMAMDIHFTSRLANCSRTRCQGVVQGPPENVLDYTALRNIVVARRVLHAGVPGAGAGLRADVGLQQRQGGAAFFAGTTIKSISCGNLGYGDASKVYPARRGSPSRRGARWSEAESPRIASVARRDHPAAENHRLATVLPGRHRAEKPFGDGARAAARRKTVC